jgi:hypothetical protein
MDWQTLRNQFMRTIGGDPPGAKLEDQLIQMYTQHPEALERAIEKISLAFKAGKIHSPWGALKTEAAKATEAARNPHHDKGASRTKAVSRAEQRIRNELLHYDRLEEVLDELFGHRGTLREHDTPELRERMTDLWHELRPLGTATELEAEARGLRYQQQPKITTEPRTRSLEDLKAIAARKGADTTPLI